MTETPTALAWLDGLELLNGAVYRGVEDQRRLTMEHDAIPALLAAIRAAYALAEEWDVLGRELDSVVAADAFDDAAQQLRAALDEALA